MSLVSKLSDTSYRINVSEEDISRAFQENFTDIASEVFNNTSGKIIDGTVEVALTKDAADTIRRMVSNELTLGMDIGDKLAENKYLEALFCSPIPFSALYGSDVPSLNSDDAIPISAELDALTVSLNVDLGNVKIGINDTYRLKFIPDARGFDIRLENIDSASNLIEDHAFALTTTFIISALDISDPIVEDGIPPGSVSAIIDDEKVLFYEKDFSISGGEVLTRAFALSGFSDRGMVEDAYNSLFSLSMWRGVNSVEVEERDLRPFSSHLCGVDPLGTSIQYLPLSGLMGQEAIGSGNLILTGEVTVKFLVGNINYPIKPFFGVSKVMFDVCTDDPGWTDVGPLVEQYIGGEGIEGVGVIHSWTGRSSTRIKKETLSNIGQSILGG